MKKILPLLLLVISISAYAQKLPGMGLNRVRMVEADKTVLAEIIPVGSNPVVKSNLFYYWYSANKIYATQGGFSGTLLNGQYTEYYSNKNVKEQGTFKKGLKDDVWKSWNEDGTLNQTITWKRGFIVTKTQGRFWKKFHVFKRKSKPDSLAKPLATH